MRVLMQGLKGGSKKTLQLRSLVVLILMATSANQVPQLIKELVDWVKNAEVHLLIKSCVFYYEFEFIHPFADGNGRMEECVRIDFLTFKINLWTIGKCDII